MSYTMTFDASHKVGRGGHAKAFFRHLAREADQAAGFPFPQANRNIVAERTKLNLTLVNDGEGGYRRLQSVDGRPPSDELNDYLHRRLSEVQRALRKDAVLMRGVILQLDPKWFEDHNPDWRERGMSQEAIAYTNAALEWARSEFDERNIVGVSVHLDEYNPQLQLMLTPVTEDRRLSQKDFFKNPAHLKRQHQDLRAAVAAAGYDVEFRASERSREHLSSSEFQAKANWLRDATRAAEDQLDANKRRSTHLATRLVELEQREARIIHREREAATARAAAELVARNARDAEQRAHIARLDAERGREEVAAERDRLRSANQRLEALPPYVERWLDRTTVGGQPLRKRFASDLVKMRAEVSRIMNVTPQTPTTGRGELRG